MKTDLLHQVPEIIPKLPFAQSWAFTTTGVTQFYPDSQVNVGNGMVILSRRQLSQRDVLWIH